MSVYLTIKPKAQKVSHIWRTGIQRNYSGNEKRTMLYTWPRIKLNASFLALRDNKINWIKRNLIYSSDSLWSVPIWLDKTLLTAQASSGQKIISVAETDYRHFYQGRKCLLVKPSDFTVYEAATMSTISSVEIIMTSNLVSTWPAGSFIFPLYDCRLSPEQEISINSAIMRNTILDLEFVEAYETARSFTYTAPSSGAATYHGEDVFIQPLHKPLSYKFNRPGELLQFLGIGYFDSELALGRNFMTMKSSIRRLSRQDLWETFTFFDSKQGRLGQFWVPTWAKDIVVTQAILSTDTVINIEDIEYGTFYLNNEIIGRHIYIQFPDGSYTFKKIVDAATTTITLHEAIGTTVLGNGLSKVLICFLMLARFDMDTLTMNYIDGDKGMADLSFCGLLDSSTLATL
jgi:hypothetical protein